MTYQIIKGRELPKVQGRGKVSRYPFKDMEVGDSFDVSVHPNREYEWHRTTARLGMAVKYYRTHKAPTTRWAIRSCKDRGCVSVWRTK